MAVAQSVGAILSQSALFAISGEFTLLRQLIDSSLQLVSSYAWIPPGQQSQLKSSKQKNFCFKRRPLFYSRVRSRGYDTMQYDANVYLCKKTANELPQYIVAVQLVQSRPRRFTSNIIFKLLSRVISETIHL